MYEYSEFKLRLTRWQWQKLLGILTQQIAAELESGHTRDQIEGDIRELDRIFYQLMAADAKAITQAQYFRVLMRVNSYIEQYQGGPHV